MAGPDTSTATHTSIEQFLYVLDEAFDTPDPEHSLLRNLRSVPDEAWTWVPAGGSRSIFDIVQHVGECKFVYDNQCFGDGSMAWNKPGTIPTVERDTPRENVVDWLRRGHAALRGHLEALTDDSGLLEVRSFFGHPHEVRWFINVMVQHDLYHAGEINHIRSLYVQRDRWAYEQGD